MDLIQSILSHITKASSRVHCILYTYFILQDSFNIAVEKMYTRGTVHTKPEQCSGPFCFCLYFWILLGTFILELHSHCYFYTFYPQILKKKKKVILLLGYYLLLQTCPSELQLQQSPSQQTGKPDP